MKSVRKYSSIHEFRDQFRISYLKTNIFFLVQQKNCSMFAVVSCNEFPQLCGASRDTRCPETAGVLSLRLPASGPATGRPAVRLCPPKAPRPKRPKAKKAWRPSKCPGDLISRCKGPTSCPLRRSGGWTRRRGRSGSSKRFVSQNPIIQTSLTSSFLKATFEGGFSSWTCHTQEKRPALMITRYLLLSFFCKTFEF